VRDRQRAGISPARPGPHRAPDRPTTPLERPVPHAPCRMNPCCARPANQVTIFHGQSCVVRAGSESPARSRRFDENRDGIAVGHRVVSPLPAHKGDRSHSARRTKVQGPVGRSGGERYAQQAVVCAAGIVVSRPSPRGVDCRNVNGPGSIPDRGLKGDCQVQHAILKQHRFPSRLAVVSVSECR